MLSAKYRSYADKIIIPIASLLAKLNLSPNVITIAGLILSFFVTISFYYGSLSLALLFLILTSICDVLDGGVARVSGRVTRFGGYFDSVVDRYSDGLIFIGLMLYLREHYSLIFLAMLGSFLVSYTRARAEIFIEKCDVGIAERGERLIILIFATMLANFGVDIYYETLILIALLTHITFIQRMIYAKKKI